MPSKIDWSSALPIDPHELYLFSLRTGRQLPDQLHNHMLLWSFDDTHSGVVKNYLEWVEHCKRRDENTERLRKRMESIEKMDRILNLATMLVGILIVAALVISGKM